jgi:hypothetical protein
MTTVISFSAFSGCAGIRNVPELLHKVRKSPCRGKGIFLQLPESLQNAFSGVHTPKLPPLPFHVVGANIPKTG